MKLSIVIPAHNEEANLPYVIEGIIALRAQKKWDCEIVVVDDNSTDNTPSIADDYARKTKKLVVVHRAEGDNGLGSALRAGTDKTKGDIIIWTMGDRSDDPKDIAKLVTKIHQGYDIVFGSRFVPGGKLHNYPPLKLLSNRLFNTVLRIGFGIKQKDITNGFKAFRREVINKIEPLSCQDFDITVELPLKAKVAGFKVGEVPVSWTGRVVGVSNLKLSRTAKKYIGTSLKIWKTRHGNKN